MSSDKPRSFFPGYALSRMTLDRRDLLIRTLGGVLALGIPRRALAQADVARVDALIAKMTLALIMGTIWGMIMLKTICRLLTPSTRAAS